jgi:hypothetical protein
LDALDSDDSDDSDILGSRISSCLEPAGGPEAVSLGCTDSDDSDDFHDSDDSDDSDILGPSVSSCRRGRRPSLLDALEQNIRVIRVIRVIRDSINVMPFPTRYLHR